MNTNNAAYMIILLKICCLFNGNCFRRKKASNGGDLLPTCFLYPRDLPFIGKFSEANTTQFKFTINGMWASTFFATCIFLNLKFSCTLLLKNHRLFRHQLYPL